MHPSREELANYLLGKLPEDQAESVIAHLEGCVACDDTMQSLQPAPDTVIEKLHGGPPADPLAEESSCRDMVQRISELGHPSAGGGPNPDAESRTLQLEETAAVREYRLLEKLGEGGMGAVYKALHTKLDKTVAIKLLPAHRMEDAASVARFEREMKAVGKMEHPHIVGARDAGEANGTHYLVMELVEGEDLANLSKRFGALPVAEACELIRQAALGLQHAHERGTVHRDVKPSNLMLAKGPPATVKILDLGLALLEEGPVTDGRELTSTGQLMGTIDYMAPEQGVSTHDVDVRADIYSLGATLYRLLAGRAPFGGAGFETAMKKLAALAGEQPQSLRELRSDLPHELAAIVHRMLAKNPNDRPSSADEVARLLEPFAAEADLASLFGDPPPAAKQPRPPGSGTSTRPAEDRPLARGAAAQRRGHSIVAGGILALVALLGFAVFKFTTRDGTVIVQLDAERDITSIEVDGTGVEWTLAGDDRTYRFDVEPGPVFSIVLNTADGATIHAEIPADGLTIHAGQPYQLTAAVVSDSEPGPAPQLTVAERERAVIDWVRSLSGTIGGGNPQIGYVVVPPEDPLPEGRFDLVTVDLQRQSITDADLKRFDDLPFFTTLILTGTPVTDEGLANLGELPELLGLFLSETEIADAGLAQLSRYPKLETLHVGQTHVTDRGLESLRKCPRMQWLFLSGCDVTDDGLQVLAELPKLRHLHLVDTHVSRSGVERLREALPQCRIESNFGDFRPSTSPDRAVAEWAHALGGTVGLGGSSVGYVTVGPDDELPDGDFSLIVLDVSGQPIADSDLARFDGLNEFSTLILGGTPISDQGVALLGDLPNLMGVYLGGSNLTDAGLMHLAERYPNIRAFHAGGTNITDAGIPALLLWDDLLELRMENPAVTDAAIDTLVQIPYLRAVYLKGSGVTEQGVNRLHAAKPWCEIHSDFASFPEPPIEGRASLRFSGIHSHVDIPTLRYDATHPITIEASVRREPPLGEYAELITNGMTTEGPPCAVLNWNRESGWLFTVMADEPQSASHPEPAPGPLRIAGVWDGSQLSLYFDGQLVSRREYSATPDDDRQPGHFVIGAEQTLNGIDRYFHFLGVIDEVRISSVARYADDYTPVDRFETDRHTMALYHFDEGQGDVLIDSSGNNHHGRIIGGVWITRE